MVRSLGINDVGRYIMSAIELFVVVIISVTVCTIAVVGLSNFLE